MGKVGSSTVVRSLQQTDLDLPTYQAHFLSRNGIDRVASVYRDKGLSRPAHLRRSRRLRQRLDWGGENWRVITLFREPIARKISDLFENAPTLWPDLVADDGRIDPAHAQKRILADLDDFDETTDYVCTWFDEEIRSVFGVDLFDAPFDHDRGYTIRKSNSARILFLRLEDLNRTFQPALQEFLPGSPDVDMIRSNVRSNPEKTADPYQIVKRNITVPRETAERIYRSRFVQHLYTNAMIDRFLDCWCST